MTELLKNLPEILKAVTDPFSLLALMVLVLGFIGYSVIKGSKPSKQGVLPAPVIALSIIALSFVALAFNVLRVTALQGKGGGPQNTVVDKYNIQATFRGKRVHLQPITVPFRTSSGQLNVGCAESAGTTVSWNLPEGAREANVTASWENTDNVQNQSQQAVVTGNVATASGSIRGRDREWLGNCPGGGHGQLALRGSYIIDQGGPEEEVVLKTYQDLIAAGGSVRVPIPTAPDVSPSSCEITAANDKNRSSLTLTLQRNSDGQFAISDNRRSGPLNIRASIQGGDLVLTLPTGSEGGN
jgi:hypothetical protein